MHILIGLIVFVAIMSGLGMLMNKFVDNNVGYGLGIKNNERWGMDEDEKK